MGGQYQNMFGLFTKKPKDQDWQFRNQLLRPIVIANVIAKCVPEHVRGVGAGLTESPAHLSKEPVPHIWDNLRWEALGQLFDFGRADFRLLAQLDRQFELRNAFAEERPNLVLSQPSGDPIRDTVQAVWRVYLYLEGVGSEVADVSTDPEILKAEGVHILDDFSAMAEEIHKSWNIDDGSETPRGTLIEALWDDVTAKSKSIAMTTFLGSDHEAGFMNLLGRVAMQGKPIDVELVKARIVKIRAAKQPEECE